MKKEENGREDYRVRSFDLKHVERDHKSKEHLYFVGKDEERIPLLSSSFELEWIPDENRKTPLVKAHMTEVNLVGFVCRKAEIRASKRDIENLREDFSVLGLGSR